MALVVVDAGIAIAHFDPRDAHHPAYAEAAVGSTRTGWVEEFRRQLDELGIRLHAIDEAIAERAARLRVAHRALRLPHALVLACADILDADEVLTTDRRWRRFPRVTIV